MGLHVRDPYSKTLLASISGQVLSALATAAERVRSGKADTACNRWFGDATPEFKRALARDLLRMRSQINVRSIDVGFTDRTERANRGNAAAYAAKRRIGFADALPGPGNDMSIVLDLNFKRLPKYLPKNGDLVDNTDYHQSRFETLVHELSHLLMGTNDEVHDGETAYGARAAADLAGADPDSAKNNAENWGIFVEACGVHLSA